MFRKRSKAHRHILFILQNIQRRDLIAILGGHLSLGGWVSLRRFIHFHLRKKNRIQNSVERIWVTAIQVLSLKTGPTFRWICLLNMSIRWSILIFQIKKIGSPYIYIHIYHIYPIHILYTLRWWFHLGSAYLHIRYIPKITIEIGEVQPDGVCTQRMLPHPSPTLTISASPCHPNPRLLLTITEPEGTRPRTRARFQKRSARNRLRYDPVILIGRSHSTNADHDRLIRSRKYETKQFIAN